MISSHRRGLPYEENGEARIIRVPTIRRHVGYSNAFEMLTYVFFAIPRAVRLCRKERIDFVHAHFVIPSAVVAYILKKICGVPYIITPHGSDIPGYDPELFVKLCHWLLGPLWRRIIRNAENIICPSKFLESLLLSKSPGIKTEVIPYGMDAQPIAHEVRRRQILIVSRFFRRKGIDVFLRCAKHLDPEWRIDLVGDGPQREELKKIAAEESVPIHFLGWVDRGGPEYRRLFSEASVFVFLSKSENFPVVLMDAMENGLAVLASDIPGNREVLGDAGLYVDPVDTGKIIEGLERVMKDENLREALGKRGRDRLERELSWTTISEKYEDLFKRHFGMQTNSYE